MAKNLPIENKFEIGEKCYSVYRKPLPYKCLMCKGKGQYQYLGYDFKYKTCHGSGELYNQHQSVLEICKVKIKRIIGSISEDQIVIKYKVDGVDEDKFLNVRNRSENSLFKTMEEAENYCKAVNTKEISASF